MDAASPAFNPRDLLFLFQPYVVAAFVLFAVGVVAIQYGRGPKALALCLIVSWPLLTGLDFLAYGYPRHWEGSALLLGFVARSTGILAPLVLLTVAAWSAFRLGASKKAAFGVVTLLSVALASPAYILWVLTVGCLLTGDCL